MKYFVGTYTNKVDGKGRVSLPAAFRDVLSIKSETHFYVFPSPTTDSLEAGGEDLLNFIANSMEENAPMFSEEERILSYIPASARLVSYDKTGRFVLPEELAQFAGIAEQAVFVGNAKRFQIWQPELHKQAFMAHREKFVAAGLTLKQPTKG